MTTTTPARLTGAEISSRVGRLEALLATLTVAQLRSLSPTQTKRATKQQLASQCAGCYPLLRIDLLSASPTLLGLIHGELAPLLADYNLPSY